LARPVVRSSGLPSPRRFILARRKQLEQPAMAPTTRPRPKTTAEQRSNHSGRPPMARQSVAPCPYQVGVPRGSLAGPRALVPSRAAARTRYSRQASLARHCLPNSLPAWLYLRRGAVSATMTMFNTRQIRQAVKAYPIRAAKVRYKVEVAGCNNPWAASMRPYMQRLMGIDSLGARTLELLTAACAKRTSDTYNSAIKPYFLLCEEQGLPPLAATAATMARYIAWIGERGTIKATSLHPYLSAVNGFFKDHGAEPIAQGDLVAKVRRGLVASQVSLQPSRTRMYLPAHIMVSSLRLAKDLRKQLTETWNHAQTDLILLFRACMATVLQSTFFCRGGARVECRSGDLLCTPTGGILLYRGTRKGQRGTSTERKLLCELPDSTHLDIAELLKYFDAARTKFSAGKIPDRRWAISLHKPTTNSTVDTLTGWLQRVLPVVHEQPPDGFAWTSHSLRKGAATVAYNIGRSLRLHRPNSTPVPGSLATIWLDDPLPLAAPHPTSHASRRHMA
jgi:hypothetical protein